MTKTVGAIVLAAGFSNRFGSQKLCAKLPNGSTVFAQTLKRIKSAISQVTVVTRPELAELLLLEPDEVSLFLNAEKGMGSTIAFGISLSRNWDACLICLADMPFIQTTTYQIIATALKQDNIIIPLYKGKRGNPVGFGNKFFDDLTSLSGPKGALPVSQIYHFATRNVEVDDPAILYDIDTRKDLNRYDTFSL